MTRVIAVLYGFVAYVLFLVSCLYAVGFVGNLLVPKSIDSMETSSPIESLAIDLALLGLFAVQHSGMAREGFKRLWTRVVHRSIERSTYVLCASLTLLLLFWQWRPINDPVWTVVQPVPSAVLWTIFGAGWALLVLSTFLISHFELFGLKQVFAHLRRRELPRGAFRTPFFYRLVRHPIYLGFILAFWATPSMTIGHLLFSIATTGYILIGIQLEERDLVRIFGDHYRRYRDRVPMLIPLPGRIRGHEDEDLGWSQSEADRPLAPMTRIHAQHEK